MFKNGPALFVLLFVTFGLFVATALGNRGPAPDPSGDLTVTVFTDLPSQSDTPAMGLGWVVLGLAILSGLFAFVSAAFAAFVVRRCRSVTGVTALLN